MTVRALVLVTLAAVGLAAPAPVAAQHPHGQHMTDLTLNQGARWATDAPLREAMDALRTAAAGSVEALPEQIDVQVDYMIAHCQLPPDADAQLHIVIERLVEAADRMRAGAQAEGREEVIAALNAYGAHFDHPGWTPISG